MYSFYNGGLPNHLDNCFAEIASATNIKQDLLLCKYVIYPEWKRLWVRFLYTGPKIWSNISENLKSSHYSFGTQCKNVLLSCHTSGWASFHMPASATLCNIVLIPLFSFLSTFTVAHPAPVHRQAFLPLFLLLFAYFTWRLFDAFLLLFYYL